MSSTTPSPIGPATTSRRGTMSAADKTKLDAVAGTNTGDVTLSGGNPTGWLSLAGQVLSLALVAASELVAGVVSLGAQTFAGAKTFTSAIIASAGVQLSALWNTNGTGASDVGVKVGVSTADGSANAAAKLLLVCTGIGGTEVEKFYVRKDGGVVLAAGADLGASFSNPALRIPMSGLRTHILQIGGDTSGTWEFAIGHYNYPMLKSRTSIQVETAAAGFFAPVSAGGTHLGTATQYWGDAYLNTVHLNTAGTARPTANAANRGTLWYSKSANGAADTVEICLKSAADTYSWVTIATG